MQKDYSNRSMSTDKRTKDKDGTQVFFFPKHNPPVSIRAQSREEAEKQLAELDNRKEV